MKLLLDTHIFLWYITADQQLPGGFLASIRTMDNEVYLSVVSLWEIIVKHRLGKLLLPESPDIYLPRQRTIHRIFNLDLDEASVVQLTALPHLHRDPFDRMLICQSLQHGMILVTMDEQIRQYPVRVLGE